MQVFALDLNTFIKYLLQHQRCTTRLDLLNSLLNSLYVYPSLFAHKITTYWSLELLSYCRQYHTQNIEYYDYDDDNVNDDDDDADVDGDDCVCR